MVIGYTLDFWQEFSHAKRYKPGWIDRIYRAGCGYRLHITLMFASLMTVSVAHGHGGGLDDRGCHRDTAAGNYHCHDGKHSGETFSSKAAYDGNASTGDSDSAVYNRDEYHPGWRDADGDCRDTRQEVLIEQSRKAVVFESDRRCRVAAGEWRDPYTGRVFRDPSRLDIDHLVPLKEAHMSGADGWPVEHKRAYANDLDNPHVLIAVHRGANRSKGSRDPSEWLPPNGGFHCEYLRRWVRVKTDWNLGMDRAERETIESSLAECQE